MTYEFHQIEIGSHLYGMKCELKYLNLGLLTLMQLGKVS